jgi:hypothetical protein
MIVQLKNQINYLIYLIHRLNESLFSARTYLGIDVSRGECILFVAGDDLILDKLVKKFRSLNSNQSLIFY